MNHPESFHTSLREAPALPPACRVWVIGLIALSATGCASVYEGKYDWKEGWREGKVMEIGSASELGKPQFSDCRDKVSAQQLTSGKFASVSYSHMTRKRRRVAPLQPGDAFRPGDDVYVNVASCAAPLVRQTAGSR